MYIEQVDKLKEALQKSCEILNTHVSSNRQAEPHSIIINYHDPSVPTCENQSNTDFALYLLTYHPNVTLRNPIAAFKARTEAGDYNPLSEDEDPYNLPKYREPLADEEFAELKALVTERAQYWKQKTEITIKELFQNILEAQFVKY